jgi:hypothetical protein
MTTGVFELVRESISAESAANLYGIDIKRHRARCPFHNGRDFNLSFKGNGFHCFVCGTHGDSIEFVRLLFSLSKPIEAAKKLNTDFGLGLEFGGECREKDNKTTLEQIRKLKALRHKTSERDLPGYVRELLSVYEFYLYRIKRELAPRCEEDEPNKLWVYALHNLGYAQYLLETFDNLSVESQLSFILKEKENLITYERFNTAFSRL